MEEITDDETNYLNHDDMEEIVDAEIEPTEMYAHMRYMTRAMDRLADSATDLGDLQDWFEDMSDNPDEDMDPSSSPATPATGISRVSIPQQLTGPAAQLSLPPRAWSPVRCPNRSPNAITCRYDDDSEDLEEL
jgi:hypothetical protein